MGYEGCFRASGLGAGVQKISKRQAFDSFFALLVLTNTVFIGIEA